MRIARNAFLQGRSPYAASLDKATERMRNSVTSTPCIKRFLACHYQKGISSLFFMIKIPILCSLLFALCSMLYATPRAGTTGAQFLNLGVSARSIAMGNAFTGVPSGGAISANYNPAGLYGTIQPEISFMHYRYILDSQFSYLGYAQPLGKNARAILAGNFVYGSYGLIDETQVNLGKDGGVKTGSRFGANDTAGTLTFAMVATKKLGIGVNLKYISQEIAGTSASGFAGDMGLLYKMGRKLSFGLSVRNVGPDLKHEKDYVPLPINYLIGVSYSMFRETIQFLADIGKVRDQNPVVRFGGEVNLGHQFGFNSPYVPQLAMRVGHDGFKEIGSAITAGMGLKVGNYSLDYAFIPFGQFGEAHRISATIRFGKLEKVKTNR